MLAHADLSPSSGGEDIFFWHEVLRILIFIFESLGNYLAHDSASIIRNINGCKPMSFEFNPDEVLQMAVQIERNGARFYRKAGELVKDAEARELLLKLADWEEGHERVFADIRAQLTTPERQAAVFDPDHEAALYLRAMADGHVFDVRIEPAELLTGREEIEEILRLAIGQEKDSIIFYLGLKEIMPEKLGRGRIDEIIKEEMGHIAFLNREIASLRSQKR